MSSHFKVTAFRDGKFASAVFAKGVLSSQEEGASSEPNGTLVEFIPDREMFQDYTFDPGFIEERLWRYAYLNAGIVSGQDLLLFRQWPS